MSKHDPIMEIYARLQAVEWLLVSDIAQTLRSGPEPIPREQPVTVAVKSMRRLMQRQGNVPGEAATIIESHIRRMMKTAVALAFPSGAEAGSAMSPEIHAAMSFNPDPDFEKFLRETFAAAFEPKPPADP